MKRGSIVLAAACLLLASPVAAKPPISWTKGPVFAKSGPPPGRTAFIVRGPVNVSSLRDEFVSAFAGDTTAGQAYFVTALSECLSGARVLGEAPHGIMRDERHRLGWAAFRSPAPPDSVTWTLAWTESAQVDSLELDGADSLSAALARSGADWLVLIDHLVATLEHGHPGMAHFMPNGQMRMEGGALPVATLAARVAVLSAHPVAVAGAGHVSAWRTTGRFRRTSVDDMAESFALQLERELKKR